MPNYLPWEITLDDGNTYYTSPLLNSYSSAGNATSGNKMSTWNYFAMENNDGSYSTNDNFSYDANFSVTYAVPFIKGLSFKGSYALKRSASDSEQAFMPFTLAYLKASDALTPGNRFYSDHPSVSDYQLKEFTGSTRVVYSDQMAKNEQLNFYVNYEGSLASIALPPWLQWKKCRLICIPSGCCLITLTRMVIWVLRQVRERWIQVILLHINTNRDLCLI